MAALVSIFKCNHMKPRHKAFRWQADGQRLLGWWENDVTHIFRFHQEMLNEIKCLVVPRGFSLWEGFVNFSFTTETTLEKLFPCDVVWSEHDR